MARQLLFVRHGATHATLTKSFAGSTDLPLVEAGEAEVRRLAPVLRGFRPAVCVASPLRRCRRTAALLTAAAGIETLVEQDLREVDFGLWENMDYEGIRAAFPVEAARWENLPEDFVYPGGEALAAFQQRVRRVVDHLAAHPAEVLLVVTHGGVIKAALCHLLCLAPERQFLFRVKPASLAVVDLFGDAGAALAGLNIQGVEED